MTIAVLFSTMAMLFYALEIAIADWKLSDVSPRLLTLLYSSGVATYAAISLLISHDSVKAPEGYQWIFIAILITSSFIAAVSHFEALNHESGAVMLTLFYCLMPVAASFYMALFKREMPGMRVIVAWLIAGLALYLLSTGEKHN